MVHTFLRLAFLRHATAALLALAALAPAWADPEGGAGTLVESGSFILHKFARANGKETYEVRRSGDALRTSVHFRFVDRGREVGLQAHWVANTALASRKLELKGSVARFIPIDESVRWDGDEAVVRNWKNETRTARPPGPVFMIGGYAPVTQQQMLLRYWKSQGSPEQLAILPSGSVRIQAEGSDQVKTRGKTRTLRRYGVDGLVWGRETIWLDDADRLVALVSFDAEFDHFEALREGYQGAIGEFVGRAAHAATAALARLSAGAVPKPEPLLAIVGATLVDGTGAPPVPDAAVIVRNGRIVAAGPRAAIEVPPGARVIDAKGLTLLPGLWDMHAHFEQVEWGPLYLAAGVTTARDCGNEFDFITSVRDAIDRREGLGPRLLLAGIVDGSGPKSLGAATIDTPAQARAWTRKYHDAGFLQMKIYSSVKERELRAVTAEAHRLGMSVTGHVPEVVSGYQAVADGLDQINHTSYVALMMLPDRLRSAKPLERARAIGGIDLSAPAFQHAIDFLREHRIVVDPTLAVEETFGASSERPLSGVEPGVAKVAPALRHIFEEAGPPNAETEAGYAAFLKEVEIVRALHRARVTIVAGTDQTVPGWSIDRELELYVQAGFTPLEAIQAATIVPARVMGLERDSGSIEAGKRADLIAVRGDPLADIHALRSVALVVAAGAVYDPAPLWRSVGFTP